MPEDPSKIPSQELERQFNMLREITLKPVSSLPDGYGLRVRELKEEKVEGSVIESEESLSVLNDDVKKAAQKFNEAQDELKNYVKQLEKELKEKGGEKASIDQRGGSGVRRLRRPVLKRWKVRELFVSILTHCLRTPTNASWR